MKANIKKVAEIGLQAANSHLFFIERIRCKIIEDRTAISRAILQKNAIVSPTELCGFVVIFLSSQSENLALYTCKFTACNRYAII